MLVRLLSNQIQSYEDVINKTINETIPEYQPKLRSKLFEELLFGLAQCWILHDQKTFDGVFITKIQEDTACGGKACVLLAGYAPQGLTNGAAAVMSGWETISKFAKENGCDRISMYTDNPEVIKYLHMFDKIWETKYYQIRLN